MFLIRYLMVGVANTLVGLGTIYFAMYYFQLDIVRANVVGYSIGVLLSFTLNKAWTFNSQDHVVSSFIRYLLVLVVAYVANLATVLYANSHFNLNPYIAQAVGIIPYTVIGFMGSRYFAFRTQGGIEEATNHTCDEPVFNKKPVISRNDRCEYCCTLL